MTIYLDHAATSWPKPIAVLDAWRRYHEAVPGSPGRGGHRGAVEAGRRVEAVRLALTELLGGDDPSRLLFAPSCTHALNLALRGLLRRGDHAVATTLDHNSVLRPLAALAEERGLEISIVRATPEGFVTPDSLRAALRPATRLVALPHASNALGTIQDVDRLAREAHQAGALVLLDAAQSAGTIPVDARRLGADLVAVPSHKALLGPSGAGALLVGPGIALEPDRFGGTGHDSHSHRPAIAWPSSFEPGTGNPAGVVAWGEGIRHVADEGLDAIAAHERRLVRRLEEALLPIPGVRLFGSRDVDRRVGVLSLSIDGSEPAEVAAVLDSSFGILVRAGLLCAPEAAASAGAPPGGFVRLSVGLSTTAEDVDAAARAIEEIAAGAEP